MDLVLPKQQAETIKRAEKVVDWLEGRFKQWGHPRFDIKSEIFWEMVFDIIKVWERAWPKERLDWLHDRKIDLAAERSLKESAKKGFKKSVAYPPHLYPLLRQYWPDGRFATREFTKEFAGRFPIFRNSNYT